MDIKDETIVTQLDILRHGRCEGGKIFRGHTDVLITQNGADAMNEKCLAVNAQWDLVITSPLRRCASFASKFSKKNQLKLIYKESLREMSFGLWDGQPIEKIWKNYEKEIQAWCDQPADFPPPAGESLTKVAERVQKLLGEIIDEYAGKKILIVTHGGIIRILLNLCLGMPLNHANRFHVPYASMSRLTHSSYKEHNRWLLNAHNMCSSGTDI